MTFEPPPEPAPPAGVVADVAALHQQASSAMSTLAGLSEPAAFQALLELSQQVGIALGESARTVAGATSWAQVGREAGTTRQAAWARWHG